MNLLLRGFRQILIVTLAAGTICSLSAVAIDSAPVAAIRTRVKLDDDWHARKCPNDVTGEAATLWDEAATGSATAACELGVCFMDGAKGAPKNDAEADFWLKVAADANDPRACRLRGKIWEKGLLGHQANLDKAAFMYAKASNYGDVEGRYWIAEAMRTGEDGGDPKKKLWGALSCYISSGSEGYAPAAARLAELYTMGMGALPKNPRMAYLWSLLADGLGLSDAKAKAGNTRLQELLEKTLPATAVTELKTRRDELLDDAARFEEFTADDVPEEAVSIPAGGVSGKTLGDHTMIVKVDFDGKGSLLFSIDSGCHRSYVSKQAVQELGLHELGQVDGNFDGLTPEYGLSGHLFGAELKSIRVVAMDPAGLAGGEDNGQKIDGILGSNFLRMLRVRFDARQKLITLMPPGPARKGGMALKFYQGVPLAPVTVEAVNHGRFTAVAAFDTGNADGVIMNEGVNRMHAFTKLVTNIEEGQALGVDGPREIKAGPIAALGIGLFAVAQPTLIFESGFTAANREPLNIGMEVLRKFVIELDYPNARLYLQANDMGVSIMTPAAPHAPAPPSGPDPTPVAPSAGIHVAQSYISTLWLYIRGIFDFLV
jgi:TPR repeat protein